MYRKNHEHYEDPTAYYAIRNRELKIKQVIHVIKAVARLAGYEVVGQITLIERKHKKT